MSLVTPNFTVQPQDVWTTAGNLVEFTCQATGNPQPSIQVHPLSTVQDTGTVLYNLIVTFLFSSGTRMVAL